MNSSIIALILLYIGGAGLMLESLLRRNKQLPFLKCWLWMFNCWPHVKAEAARLTFSLSLWLKIQTNSLNNK